VIQFQSAFFQNTICLIFSSFLNTVCSNQSHSPPPLPPPPQKKNPNPPTKNSREKVTKQKLICYKCKKTGHYQNNCVSDKNCKSQPSKSNSKLKTPDLHSEINSLKQEIKTSNFQITEEQLAQQMITLK
jgi:hypothetical protein